MPTTICRQNHVTEPAVKIRGGASGSPGLHVQSPVGELGSGGGRESALVLLSVSQPAADLHRRQRAVQLTTLVQSMAVGPSGPVGLIVLVPVSMTSAVMSSPPPECDVVPALILPPLMTQCHLAIVALKTTLRCKCAASCPTVQWTAAGGRGLRLGRAPSPVGRGSSCQPGSVIAPPLNMEASTVTGRAPRAASVRVHVLWTGSGLAGPAGVNAPPPVSHKAELRSGLATAPALTPPLQPRRLDKVAKVTSTRRRTAITCLTVKWTGVGGLGRPSPPVLLPVEWGFRCPSEPVTAPPPNMAAVHVLERQVEAASVPLMSTVQWTASGRSGRRGISVNTRLGGGTSAVSSWVAVRVEYVNVSIELIMGPSALETV